MAGKGKTIWVTEKEFIFLEESRELLRVFTGSKMSWGTYLVILSMGGIAAKCLEGVKVRCPDCGNETDMTLYAPEIKYKRKKLKPQSSDLRSRTPGGAA